VQKTSVQDYLELNRDVLLDNWMQKVMVNPNDPYKDLIRTNGSIMLTMVISFLNNQTDEDKIEFFANKVSMERLKANINIGEYVYNVNLGRSEILGHLPFMNLSAEELHDVINKINYCFDKFLYYTVHHYTEVKSQLLQEKNSFIDQTHKDRLTILGQMSSSFVHEFRNPLTSVIGFIQLLGEKYPNLEYLDVLTTELNQLKFRINQFLLASKKGVIEKDKVKFNLSQIFEETLEFLYPILVTTDVLVELDIDNSIELYAFHEEFRQVLINIIMNSLDALSEREENSIQIKGYMDGHLINVSIANNGPMIPQDKLQTIFEPFFSTKRLGTGIGLYVCRKIIEQHNGTIHCESNENWTTFRIILPKGCES